MIREDIFSLPEGRVVIQWPAYLSTESIEAVKEWLALFQASGQTAATRCS